jgi:hypothetical protein
VVGRSSADGSTGWPRPPKFALPPAPRLIERVKATDGRLHSLRAPVLRKDREGLGIRWVRICTTGALREQVVTCSTTVFSMSGHCTCDDAVMTQAT